jgi:hypothetical protein
MTLTYLPARRRGIMIQAAASLLLAAGGGVAWFYTFQTQVGPSFLALLLVSLLLIAPLPLLLYRLYALLRAAYLLDRDGLQLRWGLRVEDIPMPEVQWVRLAADLPHRLPLPLLAWLGALRGVRNAEGLGPVEYMAAETANLVLVATPYKIFAISPENPQAFIKAFHSAAEMGSLTPLEQQSVHPSAALSAIWQDKRSRLVLIAGLAVGLALLASVALVIPGQPSLPLGFTPTGQKGELGPSERLLLLPVLNGLIFFFNLGLGLYFYRREERRPMAYLLWITALVVGMLLLAAVAAITA